MYLDVFNYPWLRFATNKPTHGYTYFLQINYSPFQNLQLYVRYNYDEKPDQLLSSNIIARSGYKSKNRWRIHYDYQFTDQINIAGRYEQVTSQHTSSDKEFGYLLYQDVTYQFRKLPISLNMRIANFDTDSYDTRIYAYERDVLYYFSVPAYSGEGIRYYLNIRYKLTEALTFWLKIAHTQLLYTETIGSGIRAN